MRTASWLLLMALVGGAHAQDLVSMDACAKAQSLAANPDQTKRLKADIRRIPPEFNYAFRFQAGYAIDVPLAQLGGAANVLSVVARVAPADGSGRAFCLLQTETLPTVPMGLKTSLSLGGGFFLGEGNYQVEVTVSDQSGRFRHKTLTLNAAPGRRERLVKLELPPGEVQPFGLLGLKPRPAAEAGARSRLTVLFDVASVAGSRIYFGLYDQMVLLSSLSTVLSESSFSDIRLIAYNLDQQREIFRQDNLDGDGFRRLMQAVLSLELWHAPLTALKPRAEYFDMLESLVSAELSAQAPTGAVLILGPYMWEEWKWKSLPCSTASGASLFYFQHRVNTAYELSTMAGVDFIDSRPRELPDTLERTVRACSGEVYRIHDPAELAAAIRKLDERTGVARTANVQ